LHFVNPYNVKVFGNCFTQNVLNPYVVQFKSVNTATEILTYRRCLKISRHQEKHFKFRVLRHVAALSTYLYMLEWKYFCCFISLPVHMSMSLALADSWFMVRFPGKLREFSLFQIFQNGSGYRRWPLSCAEVQKACIYTSAPCDFLTHCLIRTGETSFYFTSQHIPQSHSSNV
jgi:hypothetical protein